jgi:hypothetical protein
LAIPLDQARLRPHLRAGTGQQKRVQEIVAEGVGASRSPSSWNDGVMVDPMILRGLPLIARGVRGASAGTDPYGALVAKERRTQRNRPT